MQEVKIGSSQLLGLAATAAAIIAVAVVGFTIVYNGKVYPGVVLDGVNVGGMDRAAAEQAITVAASQYVNQAIVVQYGAAQTTVPLKALGLSYSSQGVQAALDYGRSGSLAGQIHDRLRSLLSRPTTLANYHYNDAVLSPTLNAVDAAVNQPVANAGFTVNGDQIGVGGSQPGKRLDRGLLVLAIEQQLAAMGRQPVTADVYSIEPAITEAALSPALSQAQAIAAHPLTVTAADSSQTIDSPTILSWVNATSTANPTELPLQPLQNLYPSSATPPIDVTIDPVKVAVFVDSVSANLNHPATNAVLAMQNGTLTVVKPSQSGASINPDDAVKQVTAALTNPSASRTIKLATKVTPAQVNENNLSSLGITTLISEGQTTFPGSSAARITNVTVGARQFNNVLLAPGEQFSFGKILGPVGAAQGYLPGLVIIGHGETYQYGGGLCQVASTAFRAALLAGLPINQRANHSYAVSFYTAPYGVPGVDATIYYPQVDLKFTNDTGHYILIQTHLSGDQLTFDFYGTKTKSGVIIPPHFIFGTTDATQASQTQFQRQVLDLAGNVVKTDTFTQYYAPSTDFPIEQTSNGG